MVKISLKSEVFQFSRERNPLLGGLQKTKEAEIPEISPYLVANTYGLNFIKIGDKYLNF